jgi:hypothetical protein
MSKKPGIPEKYFEPGTSSSKYYTNLNSSFSSLIGMLENQAF